MGMILRIASSRIVGQGDIVGRSGYFSLNLSANSVMRGRLDARRTLKSLVADLRLKKIVEEIPDFQQMLDNKILSAQLLVKFTKPRKMEEEDYEKLLGAYMKPISDADGVTFKLKNGKKITGSNILRTKNVEIEMIDDVRISEPALIQEMEEFLRELNSEL